MAVIVLLSLPLGWLGTVLERRRQQEKILKHFEECVAHVEWCQGYVTKLHLGGYSSTNGKRGVPTREDLVHLKCLTRLRYLYLSSPHITDEDLAHLRHLSRLEQLHLYAPHVTDAGMLNIREIATLRWLELDRANLSDSSLNNLKTMTNLERLELWDTGVTHVGDYQLRRALPGCFVDTELK